MTKKEFIITLKNSNFSLFKKKQKAKKDYDFEGVSALKKILSNEKARILETIKNSNPSSIYHLSKMLNRTFKSVFDDVKLLERFGFVDLIEEKTGKRTRKKPIILHDSIIFHIKI